MAFILLMAGPGLSGEEILYLQTRLISQAEGASEKLIEQEQKDAKAVFAIIKSEPDDSLAAQKIRAYQKQVWETLDEDLKAEALKSGDPQRMLEMSLKRMLSPWFRFFLTYDPRPTLEKSSLPGAGD